MTHYIEGGLCRDCQHWRGHGMPLTPPYNVCWLADSYYDDPLVATSKAHVEPATNKFGDPELSGPSLITAPDFGCNQWEARPP